MNEVVNDNRQCCPIAKASQLIGDVWVILIVRDLLDGPKRYNQLSFSVNEPNSVHKISSKTLSNRLKTMNKYGLINKKIFAEIPPRVEYSLTEKGQALSQVIDDMKTFGEKWLAE